MKPKTVMIGLDGATWTVLDPLMQDGTMPFLGAWVKQGARAPLRSVVPALTPPAWTSMLTGRNPGQHGIFNFFGRDGANSHFIRLLTSRDVGCETVWSYANRHGLRATVLNFPLTFPAPAIDGQIVAGGWMPWRQLRLGCYPSELYDRLKALPGFNPREIAMDMTHEEKALEGCHQDEYEGWIELHIRREQQWFKVLRFLMEEDPTDLIAILFDGVDKIQHLCWRFLEPGFDVAAAAPWELGVRDQCRAYFRELDHLLADIVNLGGPESTVIMTSDHGFGPQVRTFFVNEWLARNGYLAWSDGVGPQPKPAGVLGLGQVARHTYLLDWQRTRAYSSMPGGNGIHIVRADADFPDGVSEEEYEPLRTRLIEALREVRDPRTGEPVVAAAWRREEIFDGPYVELAPDITLELTDGGLLSILASPEIVVQREPPIGTHRPDGIFIAGGPQIRQSTHIRSLSLLDVAPLILYSLDLPIPTDLDGRLPHEAIDVRTLITRPARMVSRKPELAMVAPAQPDLTDDEEREVLQRLQALGYLE